LKNEDVINSQRKKFSTLKRPCVLNMLSKGAYQFSRKEFYMKSNNVKFSLLPIFLLSAVTIAAANAKAQDMLDESEDLLQDNSVLQMDDIQIDGKLSPSEQLRKRREKLEERNKNMVEKKIEDIRVKQEIALTNKLQDAFNKGLNNMNEDKVQVRDAAPVQPQPVIVETKVVAPVEPEKIEKVSKFIPYVGGQTIKGTSNGVKVDFETKLNLGLVVETKIDSNITLGGDFSYANLTTTDANNLYVSSIQLCSTNYSCQAREIAYSKMSLGVNGKYYLTMESKFKPYLGAGLAVNRTKLDYNDNGQINGVQTVTYNGSTLGSESTTSTYFSGALKLGAQFDFSEKLGANLEFSYNKSLSSKSNFNTSVSSDQTRLDNLSSAMDSSDVTSIVGGIVVKF
jgi:opacity protein-like surface antigen